MKTTRDEFEKILLRVGEAVRGAGYTMHGTLLLKISEIAIKECCQVAIMETYLPK